MPCSMAYHLSQELVTVGVIKTEQVAKGLIDR